jgi:hypothetical protein
MLDKLGAGHWESYFERAAKSEMRRNRCARIGRREKLLQAFWLKLRLLKLLVVRDGVEPPTPAFQGRLPNRRSGLKSTDVTEGLRLISFEI